MPRAADPETDSQPVASGEPVAVVELLDHLDKERSLGLLGATGIGVGAIVGGGVLALAGTAFAVTGPSAMLAFALNGVIALLTALTFAEMATSFPESGGTYTFAKKVLPVETAFMVGWVVWFASIVAAMLYALGFGTFAAIFLEQVWLALGSVPQEWMRSHGMVVALAVLATFFYTFGLLRRSGGGGQWETLGKVIVFLVLIIGGVWGLLHTPAATVGERLRPFFTRGGIGLLQAMGYTFIALQGFDLIAAVSGDIKEPRRNLPRALLGSLGIGLAIYLPLLFILATVGVADGSDIASMSQADPEAVVVQAVENYLGRPGLWLILVAALLSMLSALQANLLAASYIALSMARDRNLPGRLRQVDRRTGAPKAAVLTTTATALLTLVLIPDVASAGTVSSLIFLLSFALAHWTSILARRRGGGLEGALRLPWFPLIPVLGGLACLALAVFQGFAVPSAGLLGAAWLALGGALYLLIFSHRARVADAAAKALDPQLMRLRGHNPLVLVPIANPASAESLVTLASAMAPPRTGRVALLYVVKPPQEATDTDLPQQLVYAQQVLAQALTTAFVTDLRPEALTTISPHPWREICRVARDHDCESLLLGVGSLAEARLDSDIGWLLNEVHCDVVLSRIPAGWHLEQTRRVLVPVGGRRDQSRLRARLLGSLSRSLHLEVIYLGIVPSGAAESVSSHLEQEIREMADDEAANFSRVEVVRSDDVSGTVVERAAQVDLVILGLRRAERGRTVFGEIPRRVTEETRSAVLLIGRKG